MKTNHSFRGRTAAIEPIAAPDLQGQADLGSYREQSNSSKEENSRGTSSRLGKFALFLSGCSVNHSRLDLRDRVEEEHGAFPAAERSLGLAVRNISGLP